MTTTKEPRVPLRQTHDAYEQLLERCRSLDAVPTAVAYPCEATALAGAVAGLSAPRSVLRPTPSATIAWRSRPRPETCCPDGRGHDPCRYGVCVRR